VGLGDAHPEFARAYHFILYIPPRRPKHSLVDLALKMDLAPEIKGVGYCGARKWAWKWLLVAFGGASSEDLASRPYFLVFLYLANTYSLPTTQESAYYSTGTLLAWLSFYSGLLSFDSSLLSFDTGLLPFDSSLSQIILLWVGRHPRQ
jgi:hypothetical protein